MPKKTPEPLDLKYVLEYLEKPDAELTLGNIKFPGWYLRRPRAKYLFPASDYEVVLYHENIELKNEISELQKRIKQLQAVLIKQAGAT